MRISDSMIAGTLVAQLSRASERLFRLQEQVASGLAFRTPSQDPVGAVRAASLRGGIAELSRYHQNCDDASARLHLTEVSLANIVTSLREARDAGLSMSPFDQAANNALANHVHELIAGIVGEANRATEGRYLFAGYQSLTKPLIENPLEIPPYLYQGDRGDVLFQLGRGVTIVGNLDAAEVLNLDGAVDPARDDALETLRTLELALRTSDRDAVTESLSAIEWHFDRVVARRAEVGARVQHVELATGRLEDGIRTLRTLLSEVQDADITQAIIDLRSQEITYQAAAAASSALHRASLLDYF